MTHWVLVANRERARVFAGPGLQVPMTLVEEIVDAAARLREQDWQSDRMGSRGDEGPGTHGYGVRDTAVRHGAEDFARRVVGVLEGARQAGAFQHLSLVAAPEFLGMLRKAMSQALERCVIESVSKDLTHQTEAEVRAHLANLKA